MGFKYKLKEQDPNLAKQIGAKVGDVTYSKDGEYKYTVSAIDPESGQVSWDVVNLPALDKLNDDMNSVVTTAKGVYTRSKSDKKFREFYEEARMLRNKIRTHLRNEYPEEYKKMTMNEDEIEEMSTSAGAGSYLTKYAYKLPKKKKEIKEELGVSRRKLSDFYVKVGGRNFAAAIIDIEDENVLDQVVDALNFREKDGTSYYGVNENVGATLGPGPKASEEGVKDNYYVKKFKYKLVPKDKNGNYVQKGSGLEVKNL